MIETEFTFFEVKAQGGAVEAAKLGQTHLGLAPEVLDAVDVRLAPDKFIAAMIDPVMLLIAQIHQTAVALPAVGIDHAAQGDFTLQNGRQHGTAAIGNDLRVNFSVAFEQAENRHLLKSSPSPLAFDAASAEIAFVDLHLTTQRRFGFADFSQALAEMAAVKVDRVAVQAGQLSDFSGFHIQTKQTQQQPEFLGRNSGTPKIPVSPRHHSLYSVFPLA